MGKLSAIIDVLKIEILGYKTLVALSIHDEYEQQKCVDHCPSITHMCRTMVVPAEPIITVSMRPVRRMVSFKRSAQITSCVPIWTCSKATVGLDTKRMRYRQKRTFLGHRFGNA